jgi:UbiD family decarboxylase
MTVTRDFDTGAQNVGVYRTMVKDKNHVISNLSPGRQGFMQACTYLDRNKPAPIAWVIGTDPSVQFVAAMSLPMDAEELHIAGGVNGEGVKVVKCITSDILVPANSEFIIEGEVLPGQCADEGPFGEFAGYMGPVAPKPVVRITAITHRKDAIYYGYTSQMPPSESTTIQSLTNEPTILKMLCDAGEFSVADLHLDLTYGTFLGHGIVAMNPKYQGHATKVGRMLAAMTDMKRITIVDSDIDIRDPLHIEWVMNAHYHPARDTIIIDKVFFPMGMDPSVRLDNQMDSMGSKIIIDATQTIAAGEISLPAKDIMMKALDSWKEIGLPEFDMPKRAKLRIEGA